MDSMILQLCLSPCVCLFRVKRDNENWPKITRVIRWLTVIESWFHSLTRAIAHFSDY